MAPCHTFKRLSGQVDLNQTPGGFSVARGLYNPALILSATINHFKTARYNWIRESMLCIFQKIDPIVRRETDIPGVTSFARVVGFQLRRDGSMALAVDGILMRHEQR